VGVHVCPRGGVPCPFWSGLAPTCVSVHRILENLCTSFKERSDRATSAGGGPWTAVVCLLLDCCRVDGGTGLPQDLPAPPLGYVQGLAALVVSLEIGDFEGFGASAIVFRVLFVWLTLSCYCARLPRSMGYLVGYGSSFGEAAVEWPHDVNAQYTTALLQSALRSGHVDSMSLVLTKANASMPPAGDGRQVSTLYDNLGTLGPVAFFHGVHGLLPLRTASTAIATPVRVSDVVSELLDAYQAQVCLVCALLMLRSGCW
jgi:hypothetical protein